MIFDAIQFAARAHTGQYRKGTRVPYLIHPLSVARILIEVGCPEPLAVAAILHDTVEDTPATHADIRSRFGEEVSRLVAAVSEPDKAETWDRRKQHTLETLETAPAEVLLLACADKLDNIRSIRLDLARMGDAIWSKFRGPRERQRWYYESLSRLFTTRMTVDPGRALATALAEEVHSVFGESQHSHFS